MKRLLISLIAAIGAASALHASDTTTVKPLRPVASAYTLRAGSASIANTYLTPLLYDGWSLALGYERLQAMKFDPDRWIMGLTGSLEGGITENPARNAQMWHVATRWRWGMMRRWRDVVPGLALGVGPDTGIRLGCLYNNRNGNNPVAAEAAWNVGATAYAAYRTRLPWTRVPLTLYYRVTLPVAGVFFSPDYGELFYEIYLGNHSGLAHFAWWGTYFSVDNQLSADIHLGATAIRLGVRSEVLSTQVNHITTRRIAWQAVVGIAGEWISLDPRRPLDARARTISALY